MRHAKNMKAMRLTTHRERRSLGAFNSEVDKIYTGKELCPYCGKPMKKMTGYEMKTEKYKDNLYYVCSDFPKCDSQGRLRIGSKNTVILSTPADKNLRLLRKEAHHYLNLMIVNGLAKDEEQVHRILSDRITIGNYGMLHIGELREYGCEQVINAAIDILHFNKDRLTQYEVWNTTSRKIPEGQKEKLAELKKLSHFPRERAVAYA